MNTQPPAKFKILLIGDTCTDVYQYGTIDRISPEAPVPVFVPTYKEEREGMAGNVYANLVALGCEVKLLTGHHSIKTRLIDSRSKQQIIRIDNDVKSSPISFATDIPECDAVVISDYNKGVVSYDMVERLLRKSKVPVFIDTKKTDLERFQGAWVKINELEHSKITSECTGLIVTQGAKGASVKYHDISHPAPRVEVSDVTGAGDTVIATLAALVAAGLSLREAMPLANRAGGVVVGKFGTATVSFEELFA